MALPGPDDDGRRGHRQLWVRPWQRPAAGPPEHLLHCRTCRLEFRALCCAWQTLWAFCGDVRVCMARSGQELVLCAVCEA